ncbi:hypothetical protein BGY98DRAFT_350617 [Russula aff. rugulosa BPL654]|nr:hypothetical protein BGY98DRAFT_350617 [Russula aff. rugulosa BPL654]
MSLLRLFLGLGNLLLLPNLNYFTQRVRLAFLLLVRARARATLLLPHCRIGSKTYSSFLEHVPHTIRIPIHLSRNQPLLLLRICPFGRADCFPGPRCTMVNHSRNARDIDSNTGTGTVTWPPATVRINIKTQHTHTRRAMSRVLLYWHDREPFGVLI